MLDTVAIVSGVRHENLQLTATLERILRNQLGGLQCPEAALVSSHEWVLTRVLIPDRGRGEQWHVVIRLANASTQPPSLLSAEASRSESRRGVRLRRRTRLADPRGMLLGGHATWSPDKRVTVGMHPPTPT